LCLKDELAGVMIAVIVVSIFALVGTDKAEALGIFVNVRVLSIVIVPIDVLP
jgi:hypothetical protein